jgi:hypothetical protein
MTIRNIYGLEDTIVGQGLDLGGQKKDMACIALQTSSQPHAYGNLWAGSVLTDVPYYSLFTTTSYIYEVYWFSAFDASKIVLMDIRRARKI